MPDGLFRVNAYVVPNTSPMLGSQVAALQSSTRSPRRRRSAGCGASAAGPAGPAGERSAAGSAATAPKYASRDDSRPTTAFGLPVDPDV